MADGRPNARGGGFRDSGTRGDGGGSSFSERDVVKEISGLKELSALETDKLVDL